jgi:hypothetical protein
MAEEIEAIVLQDGEGAYYAIPLDHVEAYRVPDDQQAAVEDAIGDEVQPFGMINTSVSNTKHPQLAGLKVMGSSFSLAVGKPKPQQPWPPPRPVPTPNDG